MFFSKLLNEIRTYRILSTLLISQLFIMIITLLTGLTLIYNFVENKKTEELERLKNTAYKIILPFEETLRSWDQLQAIEPLNKKTKELNDLISPAKLSIVKLNPQEAREIRGEINFLVLPQNDFPYPASYVVTEFNTPNPLDDLRDYKTFVLVFPFLLVIGLFFTVFYIFKFIYNPIKSMIALSTHNSIDLNHTNSKHEIRLLFSQIIEFQEIKLNFEVNAKLATLAAQVSHDIRSPLAALEMISYGLDEVSEEKRHIIKDSIARIKGIANTLLEKNRAAQNHSSLIKGEEPFVDFGLLPLLESIVIEKNYRYQQDRLVRLNLAADIPSDQWFCKIQKNEFLRVISNLIDNAVESYPTGKGPVELNLSKSLKNKIVIQVIDQGKGIPKHLLDQLGQKGFTHGKKNGNGLGLHHAFHTLQRHHGSLSISSTEGSGTVITCTIPATIPSIKPSSHKPLQFHV